MARQNSKTNGDRGVDSVSKSLPVKTCVLSIFLVMGGGLNMSICVNRIAMGCLSPYGLVIGYLERLCGEVDILAQITTIKRRPQRCSLVPILPSVSLTQIVLPGHPPNQAS